MSFKKEEEKEERRERREKREERKSARERKAADLESGKEKREREREREEEEEERERRRKVEGTRVMDAHMTDAVPGGSTSGAGASPTPNPTATPTPTAPAPGPGASASAGSGSSAETVTPPSSWSLVPSLGYVEEWAHLYEFGELDKQKDRYGALFAAYLQRHQGQVPAFVSRAPGRVNLIGEHVDYEGYSVLPMAIALDTIIAVGVVIAAGAGARAEEGSTQDKKGETLPLPAVGEKRPADTMDTTKKGKGERETTTTTSSGSGSSGSGGSSRGKVKKVIRVSNVNEAKYPSGVFPVDPAAPVNREEHSWVNYVHAAYKGVHEFYLKKKGIQQAEGYEWKDEELPGLNLVVDGRVPQGSGLSSSSALVCATAIAVMHAKKMTFTKEEIADFTRECEKYVGTLSGGMDQAISIMGEKGFAKLIDFNPVKAHSVPLPLGGTFVIANSVVESLKAESGTEGRYNLRVLECTLASMVLGLSMGLPKEKAFALKTLKDVQEQMGEKKETPIEVLQEKLHTEPYTKKELEGILGDQPLEELFKDNKDFLASIGYVEKHAEGYCLYNRALHVYSEAERVYTLRRLCADDSKEKFAQIGRVMTESHESCKTLYKCSSPELDELVELSLANGAYGARLTGAGWGGCIVAYVSENIVNKFIEEIYRSFYKKKLDAGLIQQSQLRNCIFPSKPSAGACVIQQNVLQKIYDAV